VAGPDRPHRGRRRGRHAGAGSGSLAQLPGSARHGARIMFVTRVLATPLSTRTSPAHARNLQTGTWLRWAMQDPGQPATFDLADAVNTAMAHAVGEPAWPAMIGQARCTFAKFGLAPHASPDSRLCTMAVQATLAARDAPHRQPTCSACLTAVSRGPGPTGARCGRSHDFILTPAAAALPWPGARHLPAADRRPIRPGRAATRCSPAWPTPPACPRSRCLAASRRGCPLGLQLVGPPGHDAALHGCWRSQDYEAAFSWAGQYWPRGGGAPA
jgi:hypothetical protein